MLKHTTTIVLVASALALGAFGCANHTGAETAPAPEAGAQPAAADADAKGHPVFQALEKVGLRDEQKTEVAAIRSALEGRMTPMKAARAAFVDKLAVAVEAGKVDPAAFAREAEALVAAADATRPAVADAVTQLHKALDEGQRKALVAELEKGRGKHHRDGEAGDKHERGGKHGRGGMGFGPFGGDLRGLAKDLNLTAEQRDAIRTALRASHEAGGGKGRPEHAMGEHRAAMKELAEAFQKDGFDARALSKPLGVPAEAVRGMVKMALDASSVAVPLLDDAQRKTLAARLRARG